MLFIIKQKRLASVEQISHPLAFPFTVPIILDHPVVALRKALNTIVKILLLKSQEYGRTFE